MDTLSTRQNSSPTRRTGGFFVRSALTIAALSTFSACVSTTAHRSSPPAFELADNERNRVDAMAHFVQALIEEDEHGAHSLPALRHFVKAAELSEGNIQLYIRVADACVANGLNDKAIMILKQAIALEPDTLPPYNRLASALQLTGDANGAVGAYILSLTKGPHQTSIYRTTANLLFQLDKDEEAFTLLEAGIYSADRPEKLRAFCYNTGLRCISRKKNERAIGCFKVLATHASDQRSHIYSLVGQLQETLGYNEQAIQSYRIATGDDQPVPEAFMHLARARLKVDIGDAIDVLRDGTRRLPGNTTLLMALGNVYAQANELDDAISTYEQVSQLVKAASAIPPDDFYLRFGSVCERAGRIIKATEVFEACITNHPESHQVMNYLAYMWAENDRHLNEAMQYVNRALSHDPASAAYLDTRGWIYFKMGEYDAALKDIAQAFRLLPDDATISAHLGDTWSALGNRHKALNHWKVSYQADSDNSAVAEKLQANGVNLDALQLEQDLAPDAAPDANDIAEEAQFYGTE